MLKILVNGKPLGANISLEDTSNIQFDFGGVKGHTYTFTIGEGDKTYYKVVGLPASGGKGITTVSYYIPNVASRLEFRLSDETTGRLVDSKTVGVTSARSPKRINNIRSPTSSRSVNPNVPVSNIRLPSSVRSRSPSPTSRSVNPNVPVSNIRLPPSVRSRSPSPTSNRGRSPTSRSVNPNVPVSNIRLPSSVRSRSPSPTSRSPTSNRGRSPTSSRSSRSRSPSPNKSQSEYWGLIKPGSPLTERERKYCTCVLKVADKSSAYSPYAVCTKSVGTQYRDCGAHYDWDNMDIEYVRAYAELKGINTQGKNRKQLIDDINLYKTSKGEKRIKM